MNEKQVTHDYPCRQCPRFFWSPDHCSCVHWWGKDKATEHHKPTGNTVYANKKADFCKHGRYCNDICPDCGEEVKDE